MVEILADGIVVAWARLLDKAMRPVVCLLASPGVHSPALGEVELHREVQPAGNELHEHEHEHEHEVECVLSSCSANTHRDRPLILDRELERLIADKPPVDGPRTGVERELMCLRNLKLKQARENKKTHERAKARAKAREKDRRASATGNALAASATDASTTDREFPAFDKVTEAVHRVGAARNGNGATQMAEHAARSYSGCEQHALNHVQSDATGGSVAEDPKREVKALKNEMLALQDQMSAVTKRLEELLAKM